MFPRGELRESIRWWHCERVERKRRHRGAWAEIIETLISSYSSTLQCNVNQALEVDISHVGRRHPSAIASEFPRPCPGHGQTYQVADVQLSWQGAPSGSRKIPRPAESGRVRAPPPRHRNLARSGPCGSAASRRPCRGRRHCVGISSVVPRLLPRGVSRILCKHFRDLMLQPGYVNCAYPRVASKPVQPCDVVCFSGGRAQQHFTNEV
jgi:hypothetical protein